MSYGNWIGKPAAAYRRPIRTTPVSTIGHTPEAIEDAEALRPLIEATFTTNATHGALPPVTDDCYPDDATPLPVEYASDPNPFPRIRLFSWLRG